MSAKITSTLKWMGLTPAQVVGAVAFVACWFTTLRPMPEAVAQLNASVNDLTTKVEVHAVLIHQMLELRGEVNAIRQDLALIQGKLHANNHKGGGE